MVYFQPGAALEILLRQLALLGRAESIDDDLDGGRRRHPLGEGDQPKGVAHPGERGVGHHRHGRGRRQNIGVGRDHGAREVHDDAIEVAAQLLEQQFDRRRIEIEIVLQGFLGAQDEQVVALAHQGALDKQAVDAVGVFQGFAEAAPRFQIERQRHGAEIEIQIDDGHPQFLLVGHQPGDVDGNRAGADATAGADHGDQPADPGLLGLRRGGLLGRLDDERVQGFRRHRLEQVVLDAQGDKVAEQVDVVDIPQCDDARARVADLRQRADVVKGIVGIGDIDHQHVGRGNAGKGFNGLLHPTLQHLALGPALFLGDADKGGARGVVKDKGHEREALAHLYG